VIESPNATTAPVAAGAITSRPVTKYFAVDASALKPAGEGSAVRSSPRSSSVA